MAFPKANSGTDTSAPENNGGEQAPSNEAHDQQDEAPSTEGLTEDIINDLLGEESEPESDDPQTTQEGEGSEPPEGDGDADADEGDEGSKPEGQESGDSAEAAEAETQPESQQQPKPAEDQPTQEQMLEQAQQQREQTISQLEEYYALSEEQVEALNEGDSKAVSRLMANVYYDAVQNSVRAFMELLPNAIQNVQSQQSAAQQAEEKFWSEWPGLNDDESRQLVYRFGQAYRTVNPNATPEEFINEVGAQVAVARRIDVNKARGKAAEAQPEQTATPSRPAGASGGAGAAPSKPGPSNPFEQMYEEDIQEFGQ